ncbi:MAG: LEA type 2 family protein [Flavobacteriales bacterium]
MRLLLFSLTVLLSSCLSYEQVEFRNVERVNIKRDSNKEMVLNLGVKLYNPNGYKIKVIKSQLDLTISGTSAGKAILEDKVILRKRKEEVYDINISIDRSAVTKALMASGINLLFTGKVPVEVKGWIKGRVFIFGKKFDVAFKEQIDPKQFKMN